MCAGQTGYASVRWAPPETVICELVGDGAVVDAAYYGATPLPLQASQALSIANGTDARSAASAGVVHRERLTLRGLSPPSSPRLTLHDNVFDLAEWHSMRWWRTAQAMAEASDMRARW